MMRFRQHRIAKLLTCDDRFNDRLINANWLRALPLLRQLLLTGPSAHKLRHGSPEREQQSHFANTASRCESGKCIPMMIATDREPLSDSDDPHHSASHLTKPATGVGPGWV
ncbi:hypothetical protein [Arthrobacter sp. OV608]|uniref:hypothetical protein n=1 Tax=Arthrobacter sp. OV608 TaxID=1882768 RepID=UPI00111468FF|nr:hypothetical protein [Arthrobacter sp. OV608]